MLVFKIVCLALITLCAIGSVVAGFFMKSVNTKENPKKFRLIVRIRLGCFIAMLVLLLLVFFIK